ncbi:MAG: helix-turn-helix transcriptional regulator [Pelotomaculum sp.]|nr:helix-turn-helix transcriptional regulator [Pelotomaculum sp.]
MDFAFYLIKARERAGISKNHLAKLSGLSQPFITELESGRKQPTYETLHKICAALGITLSEFFSDQAPEVPPEVRRVCEKVAKLPPDKLKVLNAVLDSWVEND